MPATPPSRRAVLSGLTGLAGLGAGSLAACSGGEAPTPTTGPTSTTRSSTTGTSASPSPDAAGPTPSPATTSPAAGPDITHGPRTRRAVALTFHGDGPVSIVRDTLAELKKADAQVTVLAIGRWLAAEPDLARMVRDAGHELGNHTWSHRTMPRLSPSEAGDEVDRAAAELVTLTGAPGRWFRPSGTPTSTPAIRAAAVKAGYGACLGYDVDPLDYTDPGPGAITAALARSVRPGSIVSLHLGHPGTLAALPGVLQHLTEAGLAPVTVSALLNG